MLPTDIRELSRHLSRIVYLFLFVVIGVRQIVGIIHCILYGGTVDFNLFDDRFRNGPDSEAFDPKGDLQMFFASGVFAFVIVRALVFRLRLRPVERTRYSRATAVVKVDHAPK